MGFAFGGLEDVDEGPRGLRIARGGGKEEPVFSSTSVSSLDPSLIRLFAPNEIEFFLDDAVLLPTPLPA